MTSSRPISLQELASAIPNLADEIKEFATARDWVQYHTPRNLILALLGEVGELAELVQWEGDEKPLDFETKVSLDKLSQELADVSIYLLRLATVTDTVAALQEAISQPQNM